jgi:hypothetical protein
LGTPVQWIALTNLCHDRHLSPASKIMSVGQLSPKQPSASPSPALASVHWYDRERVFRDAAAGAAVARDYGKHDRTDTASGSQMTNTPLARPTAAVGVTEHGNSAILVTIAPDGRLLDRRRIDLTRGLPTHPYHHEGSWAVGRYINSPWARKTSLPDAIALVERVREAAAHGAREGLEALAAAVSLPIARIAIRVCPALPPTTEERITDTRAVCVADSVMYREALATAAEARGWSVHWYDRERVFHDAAAALGGEDIDAFLRAMGRAVGPPWQAGHKLAAAAVFVSALRR